MDRPYLGILGPKTPEVQTFANFFIMQEQIACSVLTKFVDFDVSIGVQNRFNFGMFACTDKHCLNMILQFLPKFSAYW